MSFENMRWPRTKYHFKYGIQLLFAAAASQGLYRRYAYESIGSSGYNPS